MSMSVRQVHGDIRDPPKKEVVQHESLRYISRKSGLHDSNAMPTHTMQPDKESQQLQFISRSLLVHKKNRRNPLRAPWNIAHTEWLYYWAGVGIGRR